MLDDRARLLLKTLIERYIAEGHFAKGSMAPKIQAIIWFMENGGKEAIITDPAHLAEALDTMLGAWVTTPPFYTLAEERALLHTIDPMGMAVGK